MTEPTPLEPLLTPERLSGWAQERPLLDPEFADIVLDAVTTLIRQHGNATWTAATAPKRALDIGYFVSRNYYVNPSLLRSETTGPITETRAEAVLTGISLSETEIAELQALAGGGTGATADTIWTLGLERADPLIHARKPRSDNLVMWDTRGGWPIEYLTEEDAIVFMPEDLA